MKDMLRNKMLLIAGVVSASIILVEMTSVSPVTTMALAGGVPLGFASFGFTGAGVTPVDIPPEAWEYLLRDGGPWGVVCLILIVIWKNQTKMQTDFHNIKTELAVLATRVDSALELEGD